MRILIPIALFTAGVANADPNHFDWKGSMASGESIEIKGVNGSIRAQPGLTSQVEVTANKTGHRSNPADVRVEVLQHGEGVTIWAVYPSSDGLSTVTGSIH